MLEIDDNKVLSVRNKNDVNLVSPFFWLSVMQGDLKLPLILSGSYKQETKSQICRDPTV